MKYKIDGNRLLRAYGESESTIECFDSLKEAFRSIIYLLEAGDICLTEEGYKKLDDSGKKYFIGE